MTFAAVGGAADAAFAEPVAGALRRVEGRLVEATTTQDERLAELTTHLLRAGGKRLRPHLVLCAAAAAGGAPAVGADRVIEAAAAVELIHLASLYHDDVLDDASVRRGVESANALWGNPRAVLAGDVLLALAFRMAGDLGPRELHRLCDTFVDMCAGQVAEAADRFDAGRSESRYLDSIRGKTAALVSTACWIGGLEAGAPTSVVEALAAYGTELGIAFQVIDDVLDLIADPADTGKPSGTDLCEGVYTLPVLVARDRAPDLADLLVPGLSPDRADDVRRRVVEAGAVRRAVEIAADHLRAASEHLPADLRAGEGGRILDGIGRTIAGPLVRAGASLEDAAPR